MYDMNQSEQGKQEGMAYAARSKEVALSRARGLAMDLALRQVNREITSDMVGIAMQHRGMQPLGPAMGNLFRDGNWQFTGKYVKSSKVSNHSRMLRVWALKR